MPVALDKYVGLSELDGCKYLDACRHVLGLASFGGFDSDLIERGEFDVLEELDLDRVGGISEAASINRGAMWRDVCDVDSDFTDRFRDEAKSRGFGRQPFYNYLVLVSRVAGGVSEVVSSEIVQTLVKKSDSELVGIYYRALLQLRQYMERSSAKDYQRYGEVISIRDYDYQGNYNRQVILSVVPGLCQWLLSKRRSTSDTEIYPFEIARPGFSSGEVYNHCLKMLKFAIGDRERGRPPLQESIILREVNKLVDRYFGDSERGKVIRDLILRVKTYRMGASMYNSQVNATVYDGDVTVPVVNYYGGLNMSFGSGVPPFTDAEAAFRNPSLNFMAVDKAYPPGVDDFLDLRKMGVGTDLFLCPDNLSLVGADLNEEGALDSIIGLVKGEVDTAVFGSVLHKLDAHAGVLTGSILREVLRVGGKCVVLSPAWSEVGMGGGRSGSARDHMIWNSQLFQDSTAHPYSIIPVEAFLRVPAIMRERYGIRVKIDALGVLIGSEENDTLNRLQVVYQVERRRGETRRAVNSILKSILRRVL